MEERKKPPRRGDRASDARGPAKAKARPERTPKARVESSKREPRNRAVGGRKVEPASSDPRSTTEAPTEPSERGSQTAAQTALPGAAPAQGWSSAQGSRSRLSWMVLVVFLAGVMVGGLFLDPGGVSRKLAASEQRLAQARAAEEMSQELRERESTIHACRTGLRAMVRLWNRHVAELRVEASGSRAALRKAHKRFEAAKKAADRALKDCVPS